MTINGPPFTDVHYLFITKPSLFDQLIDMSS